MSDVTFGRTEAEAMMEEYGYCKHSDCRDLVLAAHAKGYKDAIASHLPEAAEPVAWLKYPPKKPELGRADRYPSLTTEEIGRGWVSEPLYKATPSPVAQAPAQAGEVARLVEEAKEAFNQFYLDASDKSRRGMPSGASVHLAIDRLAALATPPAQPVLAPVVREPLSIEQILRIADEADLARDYNGDGDVQSTRREDADITEDVVHFARAIERHFGIQATTGEQSHG